MDAICKGGLVDKPLVLFSEMIDNSKIVPDVVPYNTLINGFGNSGRLKEAKRLLEVMATRGISADLTTYNTLIHSHCVHDSHCKDGMFKLMEEINIPPDHITYNSMMDGLCLVGRLEEAIKLFDSMVDRGLEPEEFHYNVLLDGAIPRWKMQAFGQSPDEVVCNAVLNGLCKNGNMEEAIELFESLESIGCWKENLYRVIALVNTLSADEWFVFLSVEVIVKK
ncbi:pentatricopeptide repeat-containing protein At1g05670, mitochondrial-like [Papaver somniferum]|uniref:pentatricopeptide repeat-containing protein At1g05670, mitochondrial-like n=1 Tax=Papaver somniferum TaxID=3469 RepID=UPI000E701789|nr:pentatricopeptide repeat-containing protein At1g05670, mitochondrial-like [Papaver somniferum]